MSPEQALSQYAARRVEYSRLLALEDAAFKRYFEKRVRGERTNGAAYSRIGNRANWASALCADAESDLYRACDEAGCFDPNLDLLFAWHQDEDYPADNPMTRLDATEDPAERELIRNGIAS